MTDDLVAQLERFVAALRHGHAYRQQYLIDLLERCIERLKQQQAGGSP